MFWLFAVAGLVSNLLLSGPGWAEEETLHIRRGDAQQRQQQLSGLIGTWLFSLDFSPTTPSDPWYTPTLKSYRITEVKGDTVIALAYGVHQEDESEFVVSVLPSIINNQRYTFYMQDEDIEETTTVHSTCISYQFNQEGYNLLGYFQVYKAEYNECTDDLHAVGILTGERHRPAPRKENN